jgi:5-methylcytosine-specific restriction endonuclease McrA
MIEFNPAVAVMNDEDLLACTRELARKSCAVEAELLLHLAEIETRRLHSERAFPSMIAFCMKELGFSEGAAANRMFVARAARRLPAILEALGSGKVHLAGLRILVPLLTEENHLEVLAQAAGKSKRDIEELAARLAPRPPVPDAIRKLPRRAALLPLSEAVPATTTAVHRPEARRPVVAPLSADTFEFKFTGSRELRDKLRKAQDLLRHRVPRGDLAIVFEKALDALIANVMKERFGVGRKPRREQCMDAVVATSPHIPAAMKREVYARDEGRCAFVAEDGRRCCETGGLEFDHIDGLAQTHVHDVKRIRLTCRAHNQHAAEQLYGRVFMERLRESRRQEKVDRCPPGPRRLATEIASPGCPGADRQQSLF